MAVLVGNPLDECLFTAPTGETIYAKWFGASLGVIDSNGRCVWNNGIPENCTISQFSMLLSYFKI
jgi:hypothetical protein